MNRRAAPGVAPRRTANGFFPSDDVRSNTAGQVDPQVRLIHGPIVVSLRCQLEAVGRENRLRKQVYPQRIATRRMSAKKASEELAAMEALAATLRKLIEARR